MKYVVIIFGLVFSTQVFASTAARSTEDLLDHNPDRAAKYDQLARKYSPILHLDMEIKDQKINPAEIPVDFFFDGDRSIANNSKSILEVGDQALTPTLYYWVIETQTHYYLMYLVYHALDYKLGTPHPQDGEGVIAVVAKESDGKKEILEFWVSNSHGLGRFYSTHLDLQQDMRARVKDYRTEKKDFVTLFALERTSIPGFYDDVFAEDHHNSKAPSMADELNPLVFVCREGNALYKCDPSLFNGKSGDGFVLVAALDNKDAGSIIANQIPEKASDRVIQYALKSGSELILADYPVDKNVSRDANTRFQGNLTEQRVDLPNGMSLCGRTEVGSHLAVLEGEKLEANLPWAWNAKTPYQWTMPHQAHAFLRPDVEVSTNYVFNPFIRFCEAK